MINKKSHSTTQHQSVLKQVPNSKLIMAFGILSIIPGAFAFGLLGIVLGIITLSIASGSMELIEHNHNKYSEKSIKHLKIGRGCAIIGLILSSLIFIGLLIYAMSYSASLLGDSSYYM
ncbi:MAG TPA: hypothetical protein VKY37_07725 [Brumimicrobium sp.]|nr:hypothetical protein [Brumimicrobium sp.]